MPAGGLELQPQALPSQLSENLEWFTSLFPIDRSYCPNCHVDAISLGFADLSDTVAYDIKKALWDDIKLARFYRHIFPDTKMQSVRIDPGTGGGG